MVLTDDMGLTDEKLHDRSVLYNSRWRKSTIDSTKNMLMNLSF